MCGIVGYVGHQAAADVLLQGLRRLEYRGYDSAGVAVVHPEGKLQVVKATGRIDHLAGKLVQHRPAGSCGVGHTRWATHGAPTDRNAHPHLGGSDLVALVHNGVIENYQELRSLLQGEGYQFQSDTDSEVIAHLVARELEALALTAPPASPLPTEQLHQRLLAAVQEALLRLHGTFGLAMVFAGQPGVLIAARRGSPLVVGIGQGEHFVASDAASLAGWTQQIVYLADHELALVTSDHFQIVHRDTGHVTPAVHHLGLDAECVDRGPYPHYMLKEIYEQPEALRNTMRGRLNTDEASAHFGGLNLSPAQLRSVRRIVITGCGTSWHAGLVGEYLLEQLARMPVEVEYASELRYRNPPLEPGTLLFAITQSGETADTLAALREIKRKGHPTLAICNVVGSTIAQEADGGIYLHAGPEIGVASTKAFTCQCAALAMLALYFGRLRDLSFTQGLEIIRHLHQLPVAVQQTLQCDEVVQEVARRFQHCRNFLYLGRQYQFPVALEGALKLKEISYVHAEGYPAAEMKHGPIALVDEETPSVFLIPQDHVYDKVLANMEEIKARGGPIIAVVTQGDQRAASLADAVIEVPEVVEYLQPVVMSVPLQLLAYHIAVLRGCDVDKPRNLAKSVTVE